jgi:hypothetical protein
MVMRAKSCAGYGPRLLQRPEGPIAKASKGEAVLTYCEPLATQDMGPSGCCIYTAVTVETSPVADRPGVN